MNRPIFDVCYMLSVVNCVNIAVAISPAHLRAQAGNDSSHVVYIREPQVNSWRGKGTEETTQFFNCMWATVRFLAL